MSLNPFWSFLQNKREDSSILLSFLEYIIKGRPISDNDGVHSNYKIKNLLNIISKKMDILNIKYITNPFWEEIERAIFGGEKKGVDDGNDNNRIGENKASIKGVQKNKDTYGNEKMHQINKRNENGMHIFLIKGEAISGKCGGVCTDLGLFCRVIRAKNKDHSGHN
ncbi:MAG: hypothetical protein ACTSU2_09165 [Promethearchaeota archaeon]